MENSGKSVDRVEGPITKVMIHGKHRSFVGTFS